MHRFAKESVSPHLDREQCEPAACINRLSIDSCSSNEFKQQEQDVVTHVRDAMQLVENSLLERDQVNFII